MMISSPQFGEYTANTSEPLSIEDQSSASLISSKCFTPMIHFAFKLYNGNSSLSTTVLLFEIVPWNLIEILFVGQKSRPLASSNIRSSNLVSFPVSIIDDKISHFIEGLSHPYISIISLLLIGNTTLGHDVLTFMCSIRLKQNSHLVANMIGSNVSVNINE